MRLKNHSDKMALAVAITAIAILLLTMSPAMAQDSGGSEPRDIVWVALIGSILALLFCVFLAISLSLIHI